MSTRLFVGNLSHSVREKHLERLFSIYGGILSAEVLRDPRTGQSQCYGFVEMSDDAEAERVIRLLDNAFFWQRAFAGVQVYPQDSPPQRPPDTLAAPPDLTCPFKEGDPAPFEQEETGGPPLMAQERQIAARA